MDNGSSTNINFLDTLINIGIGRRDVEQRTTTLVGFNGERQETVREIVLPIYVEGLNNRVLFHVVEARTNNHGETMDPQPSNSVLHLSPDDQIPYSLGNQGHPWRPKSLEGMLFNRFSNYVLVSKHKETRDTSVWIKKDRIFARSFD